MNVGIVGVGFMGMVHYRAYGGVPGARVAAIATRDPKKLSGDWRAIKGNFGAPGEFVHLGEIARYSDWRQLVADPTIDLVDVCLPPAMHPEVAIAALAAGKHVLVEKPIALSTAAAESMVAAAEQYGRLLLIGHVLPFFPEYAYAARLIASGEYGRLLGGHFKRIIADPSWIKDFFDPATVGGPIVDLHIHDAHFIRMTCGMPEAVFSTGRLRGEVVEFVDTQFVYRASNLAVTARSGVISQQGRSFTHGFEIQLERATLVYDFAVVEGQPTTYIPLTLLGPDGQVLQPELPAGDAFEAELTEVANSVSGGRASAILAGTLALDALRLCHLQTESVRAGEPRRV